MRTTAAVTRVLMWVFFAFSLLMQGMSIFAIEFVNNQRARELNMPKSVYNVAPLLIFTLLLIAAVVLFTVLKKHRYIGMILAAVTAIAFVVIALDLGRVFASQIGSGGQDVGLNTWDMVYRHMSPVLVAVFMLPTWLFGRAADRADEAAAITGGSHFDLSGDALFSDDRKGRADTSAPQKKGVKALTGRFRKEKAGL